MPALTKHREHFASRQNRENHRQRQQKLAGPSGMDVEPADRQECDDEDRAEDEPPTEQERESVRVIAERVFRPLCRVSLFVATH